MNTLRQLCAALVLTLMLAFSAFAGEMTTMRETPPPPPSPLAGEMSTGRAGEMSTTVTGTDLATEVALSLLQSVLTVF